MSHSPPDSSDRHSDPEAGGRAKCPVCEAAFPAESGSAPFCSARCRTIDMGRWLGGNYTISRPLNQADLEE